MIPFTSGNMIENDHSVDANEKVEAAESGESEGK